MSRDLTSGMATAIDAEVVRPVLLYEGHFADDAVVRLWTGIGNLSWDGHTWTGGGNLLSISPLGENDELRAEGFQVTLSGVPEFNVYEALANMRQGMAGFLWLALLNADDSVIADPYLLVEGKLDTAPVRDDGDRSDITVTYESVLIDLDKARDRRYTNEDQQIDYPGDTGFRYVAKLQDAAIVWGGPGAAASAIATPIPITNAR